MKPKRSLSMESAEDRRRMKEAGQRIGVLRSCISCSGESGTAPLRKILVKSEKAGAPPRVAYLCRNCVIDRPHLVRGD